MGSRDARFIARAFGARLNDTHKERKGGAPSVLVALTKFPCLVDVLDMKERRATFEENRKQRRATLHRQLAKAQELVRKCVPPTVSLVDELIAERREESRRESDPRS